MEIISQAHLERLVGLINRTLNRPQEPYTRIDDRSTKPTLVVFTCPVHMVA